ncbi:MAG: YfhO family protein, partial [Candidatus Onthomonas sp.]
GNYAAEFQDQDEAYEEATGGMGQALAAIEDDSFYRIAQKSISINQGMMLGYRGVSAYYSVIPASISDYATDICLGAQIQSFRVCGLEERAAPTALAAVKYYVAEGGEQAPYGFQAVESLKDGAYTLYENEYALPLGYTYSSYITREEYDQLTPLEKQQVMLESAVLEQPADSLEQGALSFREEAIPCTVTKTDGINLNQEKKELFTSANGSIRISFEGKENCETYVVLKGLRYKDTDSTNEMGVYAQGVGNRQSTTVRGRDNSYYFDREGIILNLGYTEQAQDHCTITFGKSSTLCYDDIYVVCVPMDDYERQISGLSETVMENVSEQGDVITGTIDLKESRLLTLSVPYAAGWKAYVNGQEQELLQVNVMYCGLLLEPGSYEIELRYEQPGQKTGTMISAISIGAILPVAAVTHWKRKKAEKTEI